MLLSCLFCSKRQETTCNKTTMPRTQQRTHGASFLQFQLTAINLFFLKFKSPIRVNNKPQNKRNICSVTIQDVVFCKSPPDSVPRELFHLSTEPLCAPTYITVQAIEQIKHMPAIIWITTMQTFAHPCNRDQYHLSLD